ncbi:MAG: glutathione S-transferase N-terminal domain-containing protein, partial [Alphaproteobacteria bacterium]
MARILHDLTAGGDRRFSPYCWRTKLALAHKGLAYETRALRFVDIDGLSDGARLTLPTLDDGDRRITDSWKIALHLEAAYPDSPSLFPTGQPVARFAQAWTNTQVNPALIRVILRDVHDALDPADRRYFRESREARFGMTLEAFSADRAAALDRFRAALQPIRDVLGDQPFLAGTQPAYADYAPA